MGRMASYRSLKRKKSLRSNEFVWYVIALIAALQTVERI
jgi:hypothetical protein